MDKSRDLTTAEGSAVAKTRGSAGLPRGARMACVASVGLLMLCLLVVLSLAIGSKNLSASEVIHGLFAHDNSRESLIVWQLRFPRTTLALLVGASLGVAGVLMQALTRNPLADPGILGVNSGASLSVVLALTFFGVSSASGYIWFALFGSALASCFVYVLV